MYLKFEINDQQKEIMSLTHECKSYCVTSDNKGFRVYYDIEKSLYEKVNKDAWLNCFVMNESGKTIDKISLPVD